MTNAALDKKLEEVMANRHRSLIRMLSIIKKDLDARITEQLQEKGYEGFKIGDMALLANIPQEGTINNELAKKARITKQAMSKVVKSLEKDGYIYTRKHETDNRATVIFLSDRGKQLVIDVSGCMREIQGFYTDIIGEENTEILRNILFKLVETIYPGLCLPAK